MSQEDQQHSLGPEDVEKLLVQADVFLQKHRNQPSQSPESVSALRSSVKKDLLAIASKPTAILRKALELVEGAIGALRNFITGTGELPNAVVTKIGKRRAVTQAIEDQRQTAVDHLRNALPAPDNATPQLIPTANAAEVRTGLIAWRDRLIARGLFAAYYEIAGYGFVIIYGQHQDEQVLTQAAVNTVRQFKTLPAPPLQLILPMPEEAESGDPFYGLDPECAKLLAANGLNVEQLLAMTDQAMLEVPGIGKKRMRAIRNWLAR